MAVKEDNSFITRLVRSQHPLRHLSRLVCIQTPLRIWLRINLIFTVVIFGDPDDGHPVGSIPASKVDIICHSGDNICAGGDLVLPTHLTVSEIGSIISELG